MKNILLIVFAMILLMSCTKEKEIYIDSVYNYPNGVVVDQKAMPNPARYTIQIRYIARTNLNRNPRQLIKARGYVVNTIYVSKMEYMNYHIGDTIK